MVDLVIEDGSIVPDANSYASVAVIRDYAEARGVELPTDDGAVAIMAINAMDYIEAQKARYKGQRVSSRAQRLSFPRDGVVVEGERLPSDEIPRELIEAQCQLCIEIKRGIDLLPTRAGGDWVKRDKTGPLETEYSELVRLSVSNAPQMPAVDALLGDLLDPAAAGLRLRAVRV